MTGSDNEAGDASARAGLERLRGMLGEFDDIEERVSHGEAAWFVRGGRQVAAFSDRHHDDRVAVWIAAPPGVQESLVSTHTGRYFRPPYVGHRGWVGAYLDVSCDWGEIAGLVAMAVEVARAGRRSKRS